MSICNARKLSYPINLFEHFFLCDIFFFYSSKEKHAHAAALRDSSCLMWKKNLFIKYSHSEIFSSNSIDGNEEKKMRRISEEWREKEEKKNTRIWASGDWMKWAMIPSAHILLPGGQQTPWTLAMSSFDRVKNRIIERHRRRKKCIHIVRHPKTLIMKNWHGVQRQSWANQNEKKTASCNRSCRE